MSGFPVLAVPTPRLSVPSRQYYRSASGSPTRQQQHFQQHVDGLISQLTPATAVSLLRFPTGPLKTCLEAATASEQSFAMRSALAAGSIQEWLDELKAWSWPVGGGSAGFEEPVPRRCASATDTTTPKSSPAPAGAPSPATPKTPERQVVRAVSQPDGRQRLGADGPWMGSLSASRVKQYEARLAEIARDIDDLEVEDLKRHVLHHHILPLSPPGSPPIGGRLRAASSASAAAFTRMDDLTAVVTAIVLQTLPLLSKLVRLLDVWRVRLLVLRKVPTLLASLDAAEAAIRAAWGAVRVGSKEGRTAAGPGPEPAGRPSLRRDEYAVMKSVVEAKVSRAAQITDFMLDSLDGWEDTIPDQWIDRIDTIERDYGEWVAVCDRRIRESDWKRVMQDRPALPLPGSTPNPAPKPAPQAPILHPGTPGTPGTPDTPGTPGTPGTPDTSGMLMTAMRDGNDRSLKERSDDQDSVDSAPLPHTPLHALSLQSSLESLRSEPELPCFRLAKPFDNGDEEPISPSASVVRIPSDALLPSDADPVSDGPVPRSFAHGLPDDSPDLLGDGTDLPEVDDAEELRVAAGTSPSSSPPDFRASIRSTVTFSDMPTVAEIPDEESPADPRTPVESSFLFDDVANDDADADMSTGMASPGSPDSMGSRRLSIGSEDDQLQQQISEILESIPAKIHLSSQPSPTYSHLNPPDFKLPRKAKAPAAAVDGTRSLSSMSSMSARSMTPSFLLAPAFARNPRPRQQRGNQEIKLYHLSRSTGEAPIKLFIRLVGENGERVMVRVGGGWADLSEYLKEYASHHSRRSKSGAESKIEIRDLPVATASAALHSRVGSSPPSRPGSALDSPPAAMAPLNVRKTRRGVGVGASASDDTSGAGGTHGAGGASGSKDSSAKNPRTPLASVTKAANETPSSEASARSRPSSRLSWTEEDSTLGMSGPRAKHITMSDESKAWVESVKERVRIASGERRVSDQLEGKFGEIGRVGGTKRLFRKGQAGAKGPGEK